MVKKVFPTVPYPNPNIIPPGGYRFPLSEGREAIGFDLPSLYLAIRHARVTMDEPPGDPEAEYAVWLCATFPDHCLGAVSVPAVGGPATTVPPALLQRVRAWVDDIDPRLVTLVSSDEATGRSGACLKCPLNQPYAGCCGEQAQGASVAGRAAALRGDRDVMFGRDLKGCKALGIDTRAGVWLDLEFIPVAADAQLPSFCWNRGRA